MLMQIRQADADMANVLLKLPHSEVLVVHVHQCLLLDCTHSFRTELIKMLVFKLNVAVDY